MKNIAAMNQHYKNFSLEYFLNAQYELGIEAIELWLSAPHFALDHLSYDDCKRTLKLLNKRNQKVIAVTCPSFDYHYQYAHDNVNFRKKSIEYFKNGIRVASSLGAKYMTANSGWGNKLIDVAEAWKNSQETMSEVLKFAEKKGVIIVMESLVKEETNLANTLENTKKYYYEINHPNLKIMVDTVAVYEAGETLEDWFKVFGEDIKHMHFVDGGHSYDHFVWGDGRYPLEKMIATIDVNVYSGYISQEIIAEDYLDDPVRADRRNIYMLEKAFNKTL